MGKNIDNTKINIFLKKPDKLRIDHYVTSTLLDIKDKYSIKQLRILVSVNLSITDQRYPFLPIKLIEIFCLYKH